MVYNRGTREITMVMRVGWAGSSCMSAPQESQTWVAMEFPIIPITVSKLGKFRVNLTVKGGPEM